MSYIIYPDDKSVNSDVKIVFMGTPEFSVPILEKLIISEYKPVAVFCAPDKPVGRKQILTPPPIKVLAQKYSIPIYQPKDKKELTEQMKNASPDLIISAAFGMILPKAALELPRFGCLNVHPSLLPKYRGPSPIQSAILNGDTETGGTIYKMDEQIDHGAIVAQKIMSVNAVIASVPQLRDAKQSRDIAAVRGIAASPRNSWTSRNDKPTTPELSKILSNLGAELLLKTLPDWLAGQITPQPQNDSQATYTKIITKENGKINWQKSAPEIERQIRAYTPWPGAYTATTDYRLPATAKLKILKAVILRSSCAKTPLLYPPYAKGGWGVKILSLLRRRLFSNPLNSPLQGGQPGEIFITDADDLAVQTGNDALIIKNLQLEGGKPLSAQDFLRGHKDIIGKILT